MAEQEPVVKSGMFAEPVAEKSFPAAAAGIAAVAVVILVAVLVMLGRRPAQPAPNTVLPAAPYADNLDVSDLQMSESTSLSGGKSTYIDGKIANHGTETVTGVTLQVMFANDSAMPPQMETVPLSLVRTREPYVDTQPVSAAPLAPGASAEFRLIFEDIHDNWNQQMPGMRAVRITTR